MHLLRNHVVGIPIDIYCGDRDHQRIGWSDVARNNTLQRDHDVAGDYHRIHTRVRHRRMPTKSFYADIKLISTGHQGSRTYRKFTNGNPWHVVHAVDLVNREALHHPVLHHRLAASAALFCGLKDHSDRARKIAAVS